MQLFQLCQHECSNENTHSPNSLCEPHSTVHFKSPSDTNHSRSMCIRSMDATWTVLKWGIGENAESDDGASWLDTASIMRVEDEVDTSMVSEELPEMIFLANGEMKGDNL